MRARLAKERRTSPLAALARCLLLAVPIGAAGCLGCPTALLAGQLVAQDGELAVASDNGQVQLVKWPFGYGVIEDTPALAPRMKRTMWRAGELARARGHEHLGTEHLILALIDDPNGIAGGVMHRLECAAAIRDEVIRIIESDGHSGRLPNPSDSTPSG